MSRTPHKLIRPANEEPTREPLGFMSLKQVAAHFGVSETTIRLSRGEFASLRKTYVGGSVNAEGEVKGARVLIVREDVMNLSRRLERAAMCCEEVSATERESRRAKNRFYRERRKLAAV